MKQRLIDFLRDYGEAIEDETEKRRKMKMPQYRPPKRR